ncbi:hypothetical protein [Bacillus halotolerans]|uniref:hypothetical protein n=1 Tax=Bacillus halotolerans TaxID=260554 RepID=UPI002DBB1DF4|nr:hypothetical protein [Bacillus halotolerans]MEC1408960.1 hypothetical protein [Bacillus halotolerans]
MKKATFLFTLMIAGTFFTGFGVNSVQAAEDSESAVLDPVVANDGPEDGINDPSSVNLRITKISDSTSPIGVLGAGEWDYLGSSTFKSQSKTFYSGGGDLRILITHPSTGPGFKWSYKLVEEDPVMNDTVSSFTLDKSGGTYQLDFDVRGFTDGDNKKAELHLEKLTNPLTSVTSKWYD